MSASAVDGWFWDTTPRLQRPARFGGDPQSTPRNIVAHRRVRQVGGVSPPCSSTNRASTGVGMTLLLGASRSTRSLPSIAILNDSGRDELRTGGTALASACQIVRRCTWYGTASSRSSSPPPAHHAEAQRTTPSSTPTLGLCSNHQSVVDHDQAGLMGIDHLFR
jgi:hypothetical protein